MHTAVDIIQHSDQQVDGGGVDELEAGLAYEKRRMLRGAWGVRLGWCGGSGDALGWY